MREDHNQEKLRVERDNLEWHQVKWQSRGKRRFVQPLGQWRSICDAIRKGKVLALVLTRGGGGE